MFRHLSPCAQAPEDRREAACEQAANVGFSAQGKNFCRAESWEEAVSMWGKHWVADLALADGVVKMLLHDLKWSHLLWSLGHI